MQMMLRHRLRLACGGENVLVRYNIFHARLLINHAENGRKYLYDILAIKKEQWRYSEKIKIGD